MPRERPVDFIAFGHRIYMGLVRTTVRAVDYPFISLDILTIAEARV